MNIIYSNIKLVNKKREILTRLKVEKFKGVVKCLLKGESF
jgi:hypothetical protein